MRAILRAFRAFCPICGKETVFVDQQCTKCGTYYV